MSVAPTRAKLANIELKTGGTPAHYEKKTTRSPGVVALQIVTCCLMNLCYSSIEFKKLIVGSESSSERNIPTYSVYLVLLYSELLEFVLQQFLGLFHGRRHCFSWRNNGSLNMEPFLFWFETLSIMNLFWFHAGFSTWWIVSLCSRHHLFELSSFSYIDYSNYVGSWITD